MKNFRPCSLLLAACLILGACGGSPAAPSIKGAPVNLPATLTAAQVYQPHIGDVWTFQNGYGDHTFITVEAVPQSNYFDRACVVWHITKDNPRAYWQMGYDGAEVWYTVCPNPDGSFSSPGYVYSYGNGCPGCSTLKNGTLQIQRVDAGIPYMVVPNQLGTVTTAYVSYNLWNQMSWDSIIRPENKGAQVPWITETTQEDVSTPAYSGNALKVAVTEGDCASVCYHEVWCYAPGFGPVKAIPAAPGMNDPRQTMVRVK